jgi:hypothetical protein
MAADGDVSYGAVGATTKHAKVSKSVVTHRVARRGPGSTELPPRHFFRVFRAFRSYSAPFRLLPVFNVGSSAFDVRSSFCSPSFGFLSSLRPFVRLPAGLPGRSLNSGSGGTSPPGAKTGRRLDRKTSVRLPAGLPGRSLNLRSGGTSPPGAKSGSRLDWKTSVWLPAGLPGRSLNSRSGGTSPPGAKTGRRPAGSLPVYPAGA